MVHEIIPHRLNAPRKTEPSVLQNSWVRVGVAGILLTLANSGYNKFAPRDDGMHIESMGTILENNPNWKEMPDNTRIYGIFEQQEGSIVEIENNKRTVYEFSATGELTLDSAHGPIKFRRQNGKIYYREVLR